MAPHAAVPAQEQAQGPSYDHDEPDAVEPEAREVWLYRCPLVRGIDVLPRLGFYSPSEPSPEDVLCERVVRWPIQDVSLKSAIEDVGGWLEPATEVLDALLPDWGLSF